MSQHAALPGSVRWEIEDMRRRIVEIGGPEANARMSELDAFEDYLANVRDDALRRYFES